MNHTHDISTALISRDPFFLFAARGLLGRDRRVRIYDTASTPAELHEADSHSRLHAIVCDLDSVENKSIFVQELCALLQESPRLKALCLAEGTLPNALSFVQDAGIHALLAKSDLGYCLHLAIQAVVDYDTVLLTERSAAALPRDSYLRQHGRLIGPAKPHPELTDRISEIVMWRIFIGLDNPDIRDELLLGDDTVRGYVSAAYRALGAGNELEAFDALSEWWWVTRFARTIQ